MTNSQLRHHNSLLRRNLRMVISCSEENDKAQERIDEVEELIFSATCVTELVDALTLRGRELFNIDCVTVTLDEKFRESHSSAPHPIGKSGKKARLADKSLFFRNGGTMANWFGGEKAPIIRGSLVKGSENFFPGKLATRIKSEAVMPILHKTDVIGAIGFGSSKKDRFENGQGPRFLKRLSRTVSLKAELFISSSY